MKLKLTLLAIILLGIGNQAEAQILKKLKNKAEKAAERVLVRKTEKKAEQMTEAAFDSVANNPKNKNSKSKSDKSSGSQSSDEIKKGENTAAMEINTAAKREFYKTDVIVTTSENGESGSAFYFDADNLAMKGTLAKNNEKMYTDSEGFQYAYNNSEHRWEKTGIMRTDAMSFMMPAMSMSMLQLPQGPMLAATEKAKKQGMNLNTFMIVEWAFIYEPKDFRNEDYTEKKIDGGIQFNYTDPDYSGSYVTFDSENRLSEALIKVKTPEGINTGIYNFNYTPVEVNLPSAVEVKMPFQDLFMKGLDMPNQDGGTTGGISQENSGESHEESSHAMVKSMQKNMKNSTLSQEDLPETYQFDWKYNMKMARDDQKTGPVDLILLLKMNSNYQGVTIKNAPSESIQEATMVFDSDLEAMVMFINTDTSKFLQIHPIQKPKESKNAGDFKITELSDKKIIGYNSHGIQVENDKSIVQVYHSDEAPIQMSNLFNFSGSMKIDLPDLDPRLVAQFAKGLVMELKYTDKKRSKNNVHITTESIQQTPTLFNKNEYQNMSFLGQLKSMKD